jgi:HAD superfamily hydrolase (TIGR01493 family)
MTQPPRSLDGVRACVFDAYGTLFDFASAAARCSEVPEDRRAALTALWRDKQLQYTWLRGYLCIRKQGSAQPLVFCENRAYVRSLTERDEA